MQGWVRDVLRCPVCRGGLRDGSPGPDGGPAQLVCTGTCGSTYPVVDGIPVLLADEARPPGSGPGGAPPIPGGSER
ncbi:hypothetical protein [Kineococcus glutinatus]|uniref:Trm112 family protein n=1 Tax=Kineococcus glutinatus TaxID=1070872 RepID=A0ABP9I7V7_9ACTN